MNALQSYSSDEESANEAPMHKPRKNSDPGTNYDDVGMDISEDSDDDLAPHNTARERAKPASNSARPPGGPPPGQPHLTHTSDMDKTQIDTRDSHRSSKHGPSPPHNGEGQSRRKSRSKSPKPLSSSKSRSQRPQSPGGSKRNSQKTRSRSKSRERDGGRASQLSREHSSKSHMGRDQINQSSHSGRGRDGRKGKDDDRKRRDEERRGRRSRSRSRSRERRRSRSRSRDRRSRSRSRERRHRSRSRERKRPLDIRKEAQQKLAALKAANPDLTAAELLKRSMEAQVMEVQKQTGITLPSYYNPAAMNPMKFAEQERKKKLLWGNKSKPSDNPAAAAPAPAPGGLGLGLGLGHGLGHGLGLGLGLSQGMRVMPPCGPMHPSLTSNPALRPSPLSGAGAGPGPGPGLGPGGASGSGQATLWANTKFSNDRDGKMAEKFRRLMGVKHSSGEPASPPTKEPVPVSGGGGGGGSGSGGISSSSSERGGGGKDSGVDLLQKQETMFTSMERQYEMARLATHTHKGFGLGFSSHSFMPK